MEDESHETGLHPALQNDRLKTLLVQSKIKELEADLICLHKSLGHAVISFVCDVNTGVVLSSSVSSGEFRPVAEDFKSRASLQSSELSKASEMFSGVVNPTTGAPRLPFLYSAAVEDESTSKRLMGRHDCLLHEVKLCKLLFGKIKFNHSYLLKSGETKTIFGVLDHKSATISHCESYLRLYYERGNELSPSIFRYLNTLSAVTSRPWPLPLSRMAPNALSTILPLYFDPLDPSTMAKSIWNLKKDRESGVVTIKKSGDDKRKGDDAGGRGKKLKLAHK
jgi:hypothetical protein